MFDLPDPFSDAVVSHLEKEVVNNMVSAWWSNYITALWSQGQAKWLAAEGEVLKDIAMATYLNLLPQQHKGFLILTVPADLAGDVNRKSKFITQYQK
jgi:hypothetical protein